MGPNDLIALSVYDAPKLTLTIRMDPDGYIRVPMLQHRVKVHSLGSDARRHGEPCSALLRIA